MRLAPALLPFVLSLVLMLPRMAAATPVRVEEGFTERTIGAALDLAHDPDDRVTIDGVLRGELPFVPSMAEVPSFGYRLGTDWARVVLEDTRPEPGALVLEHAQEPADRVDLFVVADGRVVRHEVAGDRIPYAQWPILASAPAFELPPARRHELYLRLTGDDSRQFPVVVRSDDAYASSRMRHYALQSLYFGGVVLMAAYVALLGAVTRMSAYLTYAGYLVCYGTFQAAFSGVLFLPFPSAPASVVTYTIPLAIAGVLASSLLFAHDLLDLRSRSPRHAHGVRLLAGVIVALIVAACLVSYRAALLTGLALFTPAILVLFGVGVREARLGSTVARTYLVARGILFVGSGVNVARQFGLVPTNGWTAGAQQFGSVAEIILLSLALAVRIRALQDDAAHNAQLAEALAKEALAEQVRANFEAERANVELRRLDTLKDEFLANTSHELRTPLHGILGLSEAVLQADDALRPESRERLALVIASGRRLTALVNDILDFSKLRHHELALREKNLDLSRAVTFALAVAEPLVASKDLTIRSECDPDLLVRADENRLQQILTNLLGNAVKFTERGEVVVRAERRGGRIFVAVSDTGIGIAEGARDRIFRSFEQADGSTSRSYGGTGLGLAVTKKLVELHGGQLAVDSTLGEGSTFTFDLAAADALAPSDAPARADSGADRGSVFLRATPAMTDAELTATSAAIAASSAAILSNRASSAPPPPRGRLLVADDDPVNLEVLRAQLEPAGYEVVAARDGLEAVEAIAHGSVFDGVLLDVMMPRLTGHEAAERIRAVHPHGTLPIVMLTAKSRPEDAVVGLRAGATDYLGKPFHREELLQRIDTHLRAGRTARAFRRFVPEDFLQLLGMDRFEELRAGVGQLHELTVLFADVRDFTARSERLGPERTFAFVNACHERFEPIVRAHGGFVDKFIGDAIMAIFPRDPIDAVRAAEAMHHAATEMSLAAREGDLPVAIGVGVHRGAVILGTVGGQDRLEVTVIGDAVNVAARLEVLTKMLGVSALVSEESVGASREGLRRVGAVHVRGRREPVELFEVLACCKGSDELTQKIETAERFQRGLRAYAQGDLARAEEHFAAVSEAAPLDGLAAFYLGRTRKYLAEGLPPSFDGAVA
jgi:signal transduction histidine kinase/class 3 adenylate cyclase